MPLWRACAFLSVLCLAVMAPCRDGWAEDAGRALYQRFCANCHGPDGRGDGVDAPLLARTPRNLRDGVLQAFPTAELVDRIRTGRRLSLEWDTKAWIELEERTEALLAHLRALASANWAKIERGWTIYLTRCSECHGSFGHPPGQLPAGVRTPRDLASPSFQRSVSDAELVEVVRHGRRGMPALVPRIDDGDARALAAFVRLLSPGFETYQKLCAACHGDDGRGVPAGPGEIEHKPKVAFDRAYFQKHPDSLVRERIRHMLQEKGTRMPHVSAFLSEEQVRAIIEFLKSSP